MICDEIIRCYFLSSDDIYSILMIINLRKRRRYLKLWVARQDPDPVVRPLECSRQVVPSQTQLLVPAGLVQVLPTCGLATNNNSLTNNLSSVNSDYITHVLEGTYGDQPNVSLKVKSLPPSSSLSSLMFATIHKLYRQGDISVVSLELCILQTRSISL